MIVGNGIGVSIDLSKANYQKIVATSGQTDIAVTAFMLRTNGFMVFVNGALASSSTYSFTGQTLTISYPLSDFDEVIIVPIA